MDLNIGIFGGTFDPIHNGHIAVANHAAEALTCAEIVFLPAWSPPHKSDYTSLTDASHRLTMLEQTLADYPRFRISSCEIDRGGTSYTVDTLTSLHHDMPNAHLFLIIGADNYASFHTWKDFHRIHDLATVAVHPRPGITLDTVEPPFVPLHGALSPISSSDIRARIADKRPFAHLVPPVVADYITQHHLYV